MNLNEYQKLSERTHPKNSKSENLTNYAMGLSGETGEVVDELKKAIFHGHDLDRVSIKKELGDTLHYLAGLCSMLDLTFEEVAVANIEKLRKRYPDGFSEWASKYREESE